MNRETRKQIVDAATARRQNVADEKNVEYTRGDDDSLDNFKRLGRKKNLDPVVVLGIYLDKHLDSLDTFINRYVAEADPFVRREIAEHGEGIVSRLDDIRNYVDILECLLYEAGVHPDSTQEYLPEVIMTEDLPYKVKKDGVYLVKGDTVTGYHTPYHPIVGSYVDPKQKGNDVT